MQKYATYLAVVLMVAGTFVLKVRATEGWPWWIPRPSVTPVTTNDTTAMGIWGLNRDLSISLLPQYLTVSGGYWRVRADGHVVVTSTAQSDSIWTTNSAGHIVPRSVPQ
jgi:hypothetical protein